ncbi:cytochrome p450 [Colletotrichum incanum]|uniref:Cytochrome p450 n=1 Tax=Colletotrichum incanum TaxID=1573173 RepID=A0A161XZM7_COLIC|nr:cytochrome p450 [Colletotrichum incanum]OHW98512.1 cytochrome p450 [Colletotrichum incanum]
MAWGLHVVGYWLMTLILWPLTVGLSLITVPIILVILYNLIFHPLRKYPGPKLWAATRIPYSIMLIRGNPHTTILELHRKYNAEIVRVSPNEISIQHPEAWKEVMGHRKAGTEENGKDPDFVDPKGIDIHSATRENHGRYRRVLSHGFSTKSMLDQQPIIRSYVDLLINRLHEISSQGPIDIVKWYTYTTFDIISDLSFGEPFGCLENSDYHPWVKVVFQNVQMLAFINVIRGFKGVAKLLKLLIPKSVVEKGQFYYKLVREKVDKRMVLGTPRPDFVESMLRKGAEPMTKDEIYSNSMNLILAGSDTTATALSGATYFLLMHPEMLRRITDEVRNGFTSSEQIDLTSTAKLEFLQAVLEETLRAYPPIPSASPRKTPPSGQEILGQWIPGNTTISLWHWPMYHNEKYFTKPYGFHPERWMGDPEFKNDQTEAFKPFHIGPRNCIGTNLAYAEMRMILAQVLWHFDISMGPENNDWIERQSIYLLWKKPPLMVNLTPRKPGCGRLAS